MAQRRLAAHRSDSSVSRAFTDSVTDSGGDGDGDGDAADAVAMQEASEKGASSSSRFKMPANTFSGFSRCGACSLCHR